MIINKKPFKICHIYNFDMEQDQKETVLKKIIEKYKYDCNVILAEAYISTTEFPEDKYYLLDKDKQEGKQQIPIDDILKRESKVLENCGFVNVNKIYGQYEYKISFLFVEEHIKEILESIG